MAAPVWTLFRVETTASRNDFGLVTSKIEWCRVLLTYFHVSTRRFSNKRQDNHRCQSRELILLAARPAAVGGAGPFLSQAPHPSDDVSDCMTACLWGQSVGNGPVVLLIASADGQIARILPFPPVLDHVESMRGLGLEVLELRCTAETVDNTPVFAVCSGLYTLAMVWVWPPHSAYASMP